MKRRSKRRSNEAIERATRLELLEAAEALIRSAATPGEVTVRQVVEAAGANLGAVNYHFGSKEQLVREAVRAVIADWFRAQGLTPAQANIGPLRTAQVAARFLFEEPVASRLALDAEVEAGGRGATLTRGTMEELARQLAPALPGVPPEAVRLRVWAFVAAVHQLFLRAEGCQEWLGVDPSDPAARDALLERLAALLFSPS